MHFFKENPALAVGIGLPFLLVVIFFFATILPQWFVEPPKYDLIFTEQTSQCTDDYAKIDFKFINGKIRSRYTYPNPNLNNNRINCYGNQRIYRFDAKNMTSREIAFEVPENLETSESMQDDYRDSEPRNVQVRKLRLAQINNSRASLNSKWHEFEIDQLKNLQIDNSQTAPDGYNFGNGNGYYRGGFFPFFGGYSSRDGAVINKNGKKIKITSSHNKRNYYSSNVSFVGWVISAGAQE